MNLAIIFAGGSGQRMNTHSRPKQFLDMRGKPVLIYTLEAFEEHAMIDGIILVCIESWIDYAKDLVGRYQIRKMMKILPGGQTGQESIYKGLQYAHVTCEEDSIVLIHDGVRPLIRQETISDCLQCVKMNGNAITVAKAIETIFVRGHDGGVGKIFDRALCEMARAPQCFFLKDIYAAHKNALADNITDFIDSATLMQYYGATLHTVEGPMENIKITTPSDFYIFRALLDARENLQIIGL